MKSWETIPEEIVRKAWDACGYKSACKIQNIEYHQTDNTDTSLAKHYSPDEIVTIMENAGGKEAMQLIRDPENEIDEAQDDSEETEEENDGTWQAAE